MSAAVSIPDPVKDAVRAWAGAKSFAAGAKALAAARRALSAEQLPILVSEVAEVSAELMVEVLAETKGLDAEAEPVEFEGVQMHPRQAERLGAWAEDQKLTGEALGLKHEAWKAALDRGFTALARKSGDSSAASSLEEGAVGVERPTEQARRILGNTSGAFQNRPDPAKTGSPGLSGILAARNFPSKKKKR